LSDGEQEGVEDGATEPRTLMFGERRHVGDEEIPPSVAARSVGIGLRSRLGRPILVNTGFAEAATRDKAVVMTAGSLADAVVVGRAVIANPDLVHRWKDELAIGRRPRLPLRPGTGA
jgi:2,4-dienoyl-CoA reductase-like NADH-dependent reductase (Old Yellow Enzyme family)